jgi:DNA-binding HxlR family transcriptional regulator
VTTQAKREVDPDLILSSQVAQALSVIGDRWAFLIIRDIYLGARRFEDLRQRTGAARGTLTSRLKSLVQRGILYKEPYQQSPTRYEYRLTEKGLDLYPMVLMIWSWDHYWGKRTYLPQELVHETCGKEMVPVYRCTACKGKVLPQEVRFTAGQNFKSAAKVPPRYQRRFKSAREKSGKMNKDDVTALDCFGDRWTSLVLAAGFFGLQRFGDIASAIGIATNILSDRLRLLVRTGILDRVPYRERPVRYEYHLSEKGRALYPQTVALHEWANHWLIEPGAEPLLLKHLPCGAALQGEVVCSECEQPLDPHHVRFHSS